MPIHQWWQGQNTTSAGSGGPGITTSDPTPTDPNTPPPTDGGGERNQWAGQGIGLSPGHPMYEIQKREWEKRQQEIQQGNQYMQQYQQQKQAMMPNAQQGGYGQPRGQQRQQYGGFMPNMLQNMWGG